MDNDTRIPLDSLKDRNNEKIEIDFSPDFLEAEEKELHFEDPIRVKGQVYLTSQELIMQVSIETKGYMPCSICNEMSRFTLKVPSSIHTEKLTRLKRGYFDMKEPLREALLLNLPQFIECRGNGCPKRAEIGKYIQPEKEEQEREKPVSYYPFKELQLEKS